MQIQANLINNRMEHSFCIQFHNFFVQNITKNRSFCGFEELLLYARYCAFPVLTVQILIILK